MIKLNKARANVKASSRKRKNEISARRLRFEGLEERELLYAAGTSSELYQAILDANAHPNNLGQDYIYITGNFALTGALPVITEGVEIVSDISPSRRVIDGNGGSYRGLDINIPTSGLGAQWATITIRGLELRNFGSSAVNVERNVKVVEVDNCVIHQNNGAGVHIASTEDADSVEIWDSFIFNNGVGISHYGNADTFDITNNKIGAWETAYPNRGNSNSGISSQGTGQLTISGGNVISGNGVAGITIVETSGNPQDLLIAGNKIGTDVTGSVSLPNLQNGIDISGWHGAATGLTSQINFNTVGGNGYNGISLNNSHDIALYSNTITTNSRNGILLSGTTDDIRIGQPSYSNTIVWNGTTSGHHGISLEDSVSVVDVLNNTIQSNSGKAVATLSASNQNIKISQNGYLEGTSPVSLYAGSNHSIKSPEIDVPGIIFDDDNDEWDIPVSIDPHGSGSVFASQSLILEVYKYNTSTGVYSYYANITGGEFDSQGGFSAIVSLPTSSLSAGEKIAVIAICDEGTGIGDTSEFSDLITVNYQAPRILKVEMGNSSEDDYEIDTNSSGNDQLIPVDLDDGVTKVIITFDRPITTAAVGDLKIRDASASDWNGAVTANSLSYSADNKTLTWTFTSSAMMAGEMTLGVFDEIKTNGVALDGEWDSPANFEDITGNSTFDDGGHSGQGAAGGDFEFNFTLPNTLDGDANRDGIIDLIDLGRVTDNWGTGTTWSEGDFNDDGTVDLIDLGRVSDNWGKTVWPAPESLAMVGGGLGSQSLSASSSSETLAAALDAVFAEYDFDPADATTYPLSGTAAREDLTDDLFAVLDHYGRA